MSHRTYWFAPDLGIDDEPLIVSLLRYRKNKNRWPVEEGANLISSLTDDGKQMPIIDMDFPHRVVRSSTEGHSHLYIDVPMSKWQWRLLVFALWRAGVVELGYFVWSMRRGANFVRLPGNRKPLTGRETTKPSYGWFFKLREPRPHPYRVPKPTRPGSRRHHED